jgi:hypothetical protein
MKEKTYYKNYKSPYDKIFIHKIIKNYPRSIYIAIDIYLENGIIFTGENVEIGNEYMKDWIELK